MVALAPNGLLTNPRMRQNRGTTSRRVIFRAPGTLLHRLVTQHLPRSAALTSATSDL